MVIVLASTAWSSLMADDLPFWRRLIENRLEKIRSGATRAPVLRHLQIHSLNYVHYRIENRSGVSLPGPEEVDSFVRARDRGESQALDYLDELFGEREDLKALAVRDIDGNGVPDYRISDYYGKFMEGDVDVDGDGIRNVFDSDPYDPHRGGKDGDGGGIPDLAGSFTDDNANGLPDHLDWALQKEDPEFGEIQRRLLLDHKIVLVERNAVYDLSLVKAVEDAIGKVFRAYFDREPVMPTLRTIATEKTALLGKLLSKVAEDNTSAQVFSQTQSLTIYDDGRNVPYKIGLLGLLVHEIGHSYHMSLDFKADDLDAENGMLEFPAPAFTKSIAPFGWVTTDYYNGEFSGALPVMPLFAYTGISEPLFDFNGRTPEQWSEWLTVMYDDLDQPSDYLEKEPFRRRHIVGDYSLTSPYEWYGDNLLAYVLVVLEREVLDSLAREGREAESESIKRRISSAMRQIWPGFYHGNIAPDVFEYFERLFPILPEDRRFLAARYMFPLVFRKNPICPILVVSRSLDHHLANVDDLHYSY